MCPRPALLSAAPNRRYVRVATNSSQIVRCILLPSPDSANRKGITSRVTESASASGGAAARQPPPFRNADCEQPRRPAASSGRCGARSGSGQLSTLGRAESTLCPPPRRHERSSACRSYGLNTRDSKGGSSPSSPSPGEPGHARPSSPSWVFVRPGKRRPTARDGNDPEYARNHLGCLRDQRLTPNR
jgi:hypothetical protein